MNNNTRKILPIVLTMILALSLLVAGCGGTEKSRRRRKPKRPNPEAQNRLCSRVRWMTWPGPNPCMKR